MNEVMLKERDRIISLASSYAVAEGLTAEGLTQAAVRFALVTAWAQGYSARVGDEFDNCGTSDDRTPNPYIISAVTK